MEEKEEMKMSVIQPAMGTEWNGIVVLDFEIDECKLLFCQIKWPNMRYNTY
jgi:hypothetical protein